MTLNQIALFVITLAIAIGALAVYGIR